MEHFTPVSALLGGLLIGGAAVVLMAFSGRIAGISGIVGGLLAPRTGEVAWRVLFVAGLLAGAWLAGPLLGAPVPAGPAAGPVVIVAAGLLVGVGTRLGGGCTSGHGVCGLARLSTRSLAATALFMAAGMATVYVARHLLGG